MKLLDEHNQSACRATNVEDALAGREIHLFQQRAADGIPA
jgi:hypothetical protein